MTTALSHRVALAASVAFIAAACGGSTSNDGSATGGAGGGAGTGGGSGITCEHGGKTYQPGESFPAGDGCNDCSCTSDGSVACTLAFCVSGCDYGGKHYEPEQTFPAADGCNTCTCADGGDVSCTEMDCGPPPACVYGGKPYAVGDKFPAMDGCNACSGAQPKVVSCTTKVCACDPSTEWWRKYVTTNPSTCEVIDYACAEPTQAFSNQCGCGCEQDPSCPQTIDCMPPADCTALQKKCPYSGVAY